MNSHLRKLCFFSALLMFFLTTSLALNASVLHFDFGLPIFGFDELRLEKSKNADFNIQLLKKYLSENETSSLHHFQGIFQVVKSAILFDTSLDKKGGLIDRTRKLLKVNDFSKASKIQILDYIFFEGLVLAHLPQDESSKEPKKINLHDRDFEKILIKAEEILEDSAEYFLAKGILFNFLKNRPNGYFQPMKPLEDLKRAAALAPSVPLFHFVLGQAFRTIGSDESNLFFAIMSYEKSASMAATNARLQHTLLSVYMGLHEAFQTQLRKKEPFWLEEVVYKKILVLSPNNPHALNNLGYLYAEYGIHPEQAQTLCQRAVTLMPDNAGFRDSLGWASFKNGQNDKAEKEFLKSIEMNPNGYEPHYHLGTLYYLSGNIAKASEMYQKAVDLNPTSSDALNNYAYLLVENDLDLKKAQELSKRALRIEPDNASFIDTLGWIEFKLGNVNEALHLLKKAVNIAPDVGEILSHLGKVYLELKDFSTALGYLKQAHKADPKLENLKNDIYYAITFKSYYLSVADYHKLFGKDSDPKHIQNLLIKISDIYQERGEFGSSIAINHLCEKIKKGELDLGTPLFPFYTLDVSSSTVQVASLTVDSATPGDEFGKNAEEGSEEDITLTGEGDIASDSEPYQEEVLSEFPPIVRCGLALNISPAMFKFVSSFIRLPDELINSSVSIFLRGFKNFKFDLILRFENPEMQKIDIQGTFEYYFRVLRGKVKKVDDVDNRKLMFCEFPGIAFWLAGSGKDFFLGFGRKIVAEEELAAYSRTFMFDETAYAGFLIDWPVLCELMPFWLRPFAGNPLWPFMRIYANYYKYESGLREISVFEPAEKVSELFMKKLTDNLNILKAAMKEVGCELFLRIEANDQCIRIKADYENYQNAVKDFIERYNSLQFIVKPYIDQLLCNVGRSFCVEKFEEICPVKGTSIMNPFVGTISCSSHPDAGSIPFIFSQEARCRYSMRRLKEILNRNFQNPGKISVKQRLLEKVIMEYNIPSCSEGGLYSVRDDGNVCCSVHDKEH
ncbi:MAG: tetratricopeptide repeat protein [Candidatus Riflebacteria bacterium]|nr:tetratricopeptide repeat protein [Candidatus Riflebacteria bacterium]